MLKFWINTALYLLTPGGYGHYRRLRHFHDVSYIHERDKHPVRIKHHAADGWKLMRERGVVYRNYDNYAEYVTHQKQKFDEILKLQGGFGNRIIAGYRMRFYRRFKFLTRLLPKTAVILCAGARQGTEVEVLRDLGFKNAYGIDLNPGPDNPLVRPGDFMHLDNEPSSLDLLYTNCVDHAFNLDAFFAEHARAIKPDGYVLYDVADQSAGAGAFEAAEWENEEEIFLMMLRYFKKVVRVESEPGWKWILLRGKRQ